MCLPSLGQRAVGPGGVSAVPKPACPSLCDGSASPGDRPEPCVCPAPGNPVPHRERPAAELPGGRRPVPVQRGGPQQDRHRGLPGGEVSRGGGVATTLGHPVTPGGASLNLKTPVPWDPEDVSTDPREGGSGGGENNDRCERETSSHTLPDRESNPQPFGGRDDAPAYEPPGQGLPGGSDAGGRMGSSLCGGRDRPSGPARVWGQVATSAPSHPPVVT